MRAHHRLVIVALLGECAKVGAETLPQPQSGQVLAMADRLIRWSRGEVFTTGKSMQAAVGFEAGSLDKPDPPEKVRDGVLIELAKRDPTRSTNWHARTIALEARRFDSRWKRRSADDSLPGNAVPSDCQYRKLHLIGCEWPLEQRQLDIHLKRLRLQWAPTRLQTSSG